MIKRYLPSFIVKGNIIKDIFESQQAEVDLLNNNIQDLIDNLFVETATWGLESFEKKYNIPINLDDTLRNYFTGSLTGVLNNHKYCEGKLKSAGTRNLFTNSNPNGNGISQTEVTNLLKYDGKIVQIKSTDTYYKIKIGRVNL